MKSPDATAKFELREAIVTRFIKRAATSIIPSTSIIEASPSIAIS